MVREYLSVDFENSQDEKNTFESAPVFTDLDNNGVWNSLQKVRAVAGYPAPGNGNFELINSDGEPNTSVNATNTNRQTSLGNILGTSDSSTTDAPILPQDTGSGPGTTDTNRDTFLSNILGTPNRSTKDLPNPQVTGSGRGTPDTNRDTLLSIGPETNRETLLGSLLGTPTKSPKDRPNVPQEKDSGPDATGTNHDTFLPKMLETHDGATTQVDAAASSEQEKVQKALDLIAQGKLHELGELLHELKPDKRDTKALINFLERKGFKAEIRGDGDERELTIISKEQGVVVRSVRQDFAAGQAGAAFVYIVTASQAKLTSDGIEEDRTSQAKSKSAFDDIAKKLAMQLDIAPEEKTFKALGAKWEQALHKNDFTESNKELARAALKAYEKGGSNALWELERRINKYTNQPEAMPLFIVKNGRIEVHNVRRTTMPFDDGKPDTITRGYAVMKEIGPTYKIDIRRSQREK